MILPAQHIRWRCKNPDQLILPFFERTRSHGKTFGLSAAGYDVRIAEGFTLLPGEFKLGSTVERFSMPLDLVARVCDKSTWARMGLAVQNTVIEPGWCGHLTLELTNHSKEPIAITEGSPIAQILFEQLLEPTEQPYEGKYQNQEAGPQPARFDR